MNVQPMVAATAAAPCGGSIYLVLVFLDSLPFDNYQRKGILTFLR